MGKFNQVIYCNLFVLVEVELQEEEICRVSFDIDELVVIFDGVYVSMKVKMFIVL